MTSPLFSLALGPPPSLVSKRFTSVGGQAISLGAEARRRLGSAWPQALPLRRVGRRFTAGFYTAVTSWLFGWVSLKSDAARRSSSRAASSPGPVSGANRLATARQDRRDGHELPLRAEPG